MTKTKLSIFYTLSVTIKVNLDVKKDKLISRMFWNFLHYFRDKITTKCYL